MRLLFSVLGIIFSGTLFGQTCFDLIACNFNETGDCQLEFNQNGVCDDNEVLGCTYADASNYNELATIDDGSCIYEGTFNDCPSDLNGNGSVGAEDLLLFLADYDTLCDE